MNNKSPDLECDLVLPGGVTSGVVYPKAVYELSKTFRFRSIGGTSAGAIAAVVAAAAAYGQAHGQESAFDKVGEVSDELAESGPRPGDTRLASLFQPQETTRSLFGFALDVFRNQSGVRGIIVAMLRHFPVAAVLGGGAGFILLLWTLFQPALQADLQAMQIMLAALALLLMIAGALAVPLYCIYRTFSRDVPKNFFGLCTGMNLSPRHKGSEPPLTEWLHGLVQGCAGLDPNGDPLTVKHLRQAPMPKGSPEPKNGRNIDLVLMTTNLTRGISGRFPNLEDWRHGPIFFKESELRFFFPEKVVDFMICKGKDRPTPEGWQLPADFCRLPEEEDLPVILGARLSMSFPLLLSALPLYQIDWAASQKDNRLHLVRCWFSDGGLTSNFPIHFFDSPVPVRPTFAINLVSAEIETLDEDASEYQKALPSMMMTAFSGYEGDGSARESVNDIEDEGFDWVWMPKSNGRGIPGRFRSIEQDGPGKFLLAIFDAARHWRDSEQIMMPGYRERIAEIHLRSKEGGLNLRMGSRAIKKIAKRGTRAGELLTARFLPKVDGKPNFDPKYQEDVVLDWDNHRWVRFRSMMAAQEHASARFERNWKVCRVGAPNEDTICDLMGRPLGKAPSYKWASAAHRSKATKMTTSYVGLIRDWQANGPAFDRFKPEDRKGQAPRPKVEMRMMPPE